MVRHGQSSVAVATPMDDLPAFSGPRDALVLLTGHDEDLPTRRYLAGSERARTEPRSG